MKLFITLLFVTLSVVIAEPPSYDNPEHKKSMEECAKENNIDVSVFERKKGEKPDKSVFEKPEMKCFHKCMALKAGRINEAGELIADKMKKEMFKDDAAFEKAKQCTSTKSDACKKFDEISKCMRKEMKKMPHKSKKEQKEA